MVRASTAKVGGLGFNSQRLPIIFLSVCFYIIMLLCEQFLSPVISIVTKPKNHVYIAHLGITIKYIFVSNMLPSLMSLDAVPGKSETVLKTKKCWENGRVIKV